MLHKTFLNIFINKIHECKFTSVRRSALFINGSKATETFVYVIPHVDFVDRMKEKDILEKQLAKRKLNFDLNKLENLWTIYEELRQHKVELDNKRSEISRELGQLLKKEPESDITKKLKIQIHLIKDNIKNLKVPLWSAEEAAIVEALKLPNILHSDSPDVGNKIIYTHLSPPSNKKDHLEVGKKLNLINFKKNESYYLKGDAAVFELGAKFYFNCILRKEKFIQFSNADFAKSVIIEGCGEDHTNPDSTFILHHNEDSKVHVDNHLHLIGGASLYSFFAYHAKNVLYPKALPLKYFTMGRQYVPAPSEEDSLFHVSQSSVIQLFGATRDGNESDKLLQDVIEILKGAYSPLGYHFRLSIVSADKLLMWESLRVSVEMFSTSLQSYVEVANVSLSGDFISKRLMFTYVEDKQNKFPHIVSGTLLNVPKFLGCILEQDNDFSLPEAFSVENWKM